VERFVFEIERKLKGEGKSRERISRPSLAAILALSVSGLASIPLGPDGLR
jgi:hypothetical protein